MSPARSTRWLVALYVGVWSLDGRAQPGAAPVSKSPAPPPRVLITEVRTRGPGGARDEFVEILNASPLPAAVGKWQLRVCVGPATAGSTSLHTFAADDTLEPGEHRLLGHSDGPSTWLGVRLRPDHTFNPDIPDAVGLELVDAAGQAADRVGLGAACAMEGARLYPLTWDMDRSFVRRPAPGINLVADTQNNAADFVVIEPASPQNTSGCGIRALRDGIGFAWRCVASTRDLSASGPALLPWIVLGLWLVVSCCGVWLYRARLPVIVLAVTAGGKRPAPPLTVEWKPAAGGSTKKVGDGSFIALHDAGAADGSVKGELEISWDDTHHAGQRVTVEVDQKGPRWPKLTGHGQAVLVGIKLPLKPTALHAQDTGAGGVDFRWTAPAIEVPEGVVVVSARTSVSVNYTVSVDVTGGAQQPAPRTFTDSTSSPGTQFNALVRPQVAKWRVTAEVGGRSEIASSA
jgi:hypothetical protein